MLLQVLLSSLLFSANYVIATASYPTCAMLTSNDVDEKYGYARNIYELSYTQPVGQISDELLSYTKKAAADQLTATTLYYIGFNISIPSGEVYRGDILDQQNVLLSHMAVVSQGSLIVPETGEYTFSLDGTSGGAAMFILDDLDKMCCENLGNTALQGIDAFSKFYYIPDDPNYQTKSMAFHLVAGIRYVFYFTYVNHGGDAIFEPTMMTPSGEVISNFKGYIYSANDASCKTGNSTSSSVVSQWSETYATTSTTIMTNVKTVTEMGLPYTEIETVYYVMTPAPTSASSSEAAVPSSLLSSSFLSESTLASSSVILLSVEKTSAVSSQQSSTTSSSVSLSPESLSTVPSSSIPPATSSSVISSVTLSANKTERVSSTVSDVVTSSVVSSSEEASVSSFTQSSKISSSMHTVLSNLDGDSLTKQLTESTTSSVFNTFTSGSTTSTSVSVSSNVNIFSNSSITEGSTRSSTGYPSTKSTQSNSPVENSGDAGQFGSEDYLTTSTYTDVYGMTRTTTVRCSTQSNDINPAGESHMSEATVVTVTSCSNKKCETVVSTMAIPTDLVKTTVTGKLNPQGAATSSGYSGASSVASAASVAVQLQSNRGSSSATHTVQQAPNAAGKYTAGLLFSIVPIAIPLFFM